MPPEVIIQAWQISDFAYTGHKYIKSVDQPTREVIQYITNNTLRPSAIRPSSSSTARAQRSRSRSTSVDPQAEEQPQQQQTWPGDWAIDHSAFKTAIRKFQANTSPLLLPPSTGNTPERTETIAGNPKETESEEVSTGGQLIRNQQAPLVTSQDSATEAGEPTSPAIQQVASPQVLPSTSRNQQEPPVASQLSTTEADEATPPSIQPVASQQALPVTGYPAAGIAPAESAPAPTNRDQEQLPLITTTTSKVGLANPLAQPPSRTLQFGNPFARLPPPHSAAPYLPEA